MGLSLRKKALFLAIACMPLSVVLADGDGVTSENVVPFAYGDMDNWIVREIHESGIIGGNTKWLYELGPSDTIVGNTAFRNMGGSPWATSNVMAKVAGVVKTNTSVFPEKRGDGMCARMETRYESVKVFGLVDIEVIAAGSVFLGTVHEPIKGTKNPQAMLQSGVPFSKKPKALRFDYKVKAAPEKNRVRSTGFSCKSTVAGQDSLAVILLLQKRWEDEEGNVYSKRVGTMVQRYTESTPDWVNDATYPILYGNITSKPEYKPYMRIQVEERYTLNSKGKSVPIQEVGWAEPGEAPTHMVLQFTSSHGGAYIGSPGNTFWIDNVELIY
ncbi:PCMD domain-containing protein [Parabacteroides distasonis]|uniref:PCMD domain-containing protein n=1 Tax=Parabacteroides distasonis TaxID=823 RepID=UPI001C37FCE0|nr:PCMD domain-containing protein [Parabacteroides distasonis]MBV3301540.1 PCMD domain-containing protein [Parabacteroides distasonis]